MLNPETSFLTPKKIVQELDRFIVGQIDAKRCVANALRNRWRRLQVPAPLQEEIFPKNILMIGPTGVGKTEIARRLARLAQAPFLKIEATKFTEIGYVGRDVEQIIRDLLEISLLTTRDAWRIKVHIEALDLVQTRLIDALVGDNATDETRAKFSTLLSQGTLEERIVDIQVTEARSAFSSLMDLPQGAHVFPLGDFFSKGKTKSKRLSVEQARRILLAEESDKLLDQEIILQEAIQAVEQRGIVFLDEIDKICVRGKHSSSEISREGVQRDLLPLIEGTTVMTKHGPVKTDHILFIASGAFHISKPSDLLPELQGRLPVRVELQPLSANDFVRILVEPESSLIAQYKALFKTEGIDLQFTQDALEEIAHLAVDINQQVENIGARRLHTILERLLETLSFDAPEKKGQTIHIDRSQTQAFIGDLAQHPDLSRFVL